MQPINDERAHHRGSGAADESVRTNRAGNKPHFAPRPQWSAASSVGILVQHAIPIVGMLWFGWSAGQFLLLGIFGIAFGIARIGTLGVAVSTAQGAPSGLFDRIATWLRLTMVAGAASAVLTLMFGWVVILIVGGLTWNASLYKAALMMILAALPGMAAQYRSDVRSRLSEEQRKTRDQPQVFALLLCGGLIFILSGYAAKAGRLGVAIMVAGLTALFLLRDLRPGLLREMGAFANRPPR